MTENKNHMIYTAVDIAKYFAGQLSPQDMYALEKTALDDAFLAEAMEGYEAMKGTNWEHTLVKLQEKFNARNTASAKVIAMKPNSRLWYRAAAAVLLIGTISAIAYQVIKKNKNADFSDPIVKTEPKNPQLKSNDINEGSKPIVTNGNNGKTNTTNPTDTLQTTPTNKKINTTPIGTNNNNDVAKNTPEIKNRTKNLDKENFPKNDDRELGSLSTPGNTPNNTFNKDQKNSFVAQVVSANNKPIPFANVNINNTGTKTYTDARGNIRLASDKPVLSVNVKSAGYLPQTYSLSSETKNKIVLNKDASGAGNTIKATIVADPDNNAEPIDGWSNYNIYIQNNIEIPQKAIKKGITGDIEISFTVRPNGQVGSAKIEKSLCPPCDKAAKKAIENGPLWRVKKGQSNKTLVTIRF